ncbi:DUF4097 family beta strand repeat-containing protein [Lapidilactobacillus wuchangensis]|uniref:DUF4097 family beta strand repeat-containing protein n=1 Tax=Lapidilactobacillus wuchangensis TaxID=2486001 RepID=UPI000F7716AD|nr:DUF4097 family beta strand repeat-containing protein [Lapidilactobacillus wuchangensis]
MFPEIEETLKKHFSKFNATPETAELYNDLLADLNEATQDRIKQGETPEQAVAASLATLTDLDQILTTITTQPHEDHFDNNQLNRLYDRFFATKLVNSLTYPVDQLNQIFIDYRYAKITLAPAVSDKLVINEYMNADRPAGYATGKIVGDKLKVEQPRRIPLAILRERIEILIPAQFTGFVYLQNKNGNLQIDDLIGAYILETSLTSGTITSHNLQLNQIHLQTTSGSIQGAFLQAEQIQLISNSGNLKLTESTGVRDNSMISGKVKSGQIHFAHLQADEINVDCTSGNVESEFLTAKQLNLTDHSGNVQGQGLVGSGNFESRSGNLSLSFSQINADLAVTTTSGSVIIKMPTDRAYHFQTTSNSGRVNLPYGATFLTPRQQRQQSGQVGERPQITVTAKTTSGSIKIF